MDAIDFIVDDVSDNATTFDVYRDSSNRNYGGSESKVGTVDIWIFSPTSSSQVVVEGSGEDTSLTGLAVPSYDTNDNLVHNVKVNDELRGGQNNEKRYIVRTKDGLHSDIDPDLWQLGLDEASASTQN